MLTMTNVRMIRLGIYIFALVVVGYPLAVWYARFDFVFDILLLRQIFPALGLIAVTTMYLHIIGRPFARQLSEYIPFATFERVSSYLVLVTMLLHPLLRTVYFLLEGLPLIPPPAYQLPLGLGALGLLLLLTYDVGKWYGRSDFVSRHWNVIDVLSTLGFYIVWVHALMLGGDLQEGPLRSVWIFYGVTAALASCYTVYQKAWKAVAPGS